MTPKRIYLLGMPASGKSTLGKALSEASGWGFLDLDAAIEEAEGKSIPAIFEKEGEAAFRKVEQKALSENLPDYSIIATGGGTPCFFDNMGFILKNGLSVFLNPSIELLVKRAVLQGGRPLLSGGHPDILAKINNLYQTRLPYYQKALWHLPKPQETDIYEFWGRVSVWV